VRGNRTEEVAEVKQVVLADEVFRKEVGVVCAELHGGDEGEEEEGHDLSWEPEVSGGNSPCQVLETILHPVNLVTSAPSVLCKPSENAVTSLQLQIYPIHPLGLSQLHIISDNHDTCTQHPVNRSQSEIFPRFVSSLEPSGAPLCVAVAVVSVNSLSTSE